MTSIETAVLNWYHARRDWMQFATARSNYSNEDRDRICESMDAAEIALEAEAAKLTENARAA